MQRKVIGMQPDCLAQYSTACKEKYKRKIRKHVNIGKKKKVSLTIGITKVYEI